MLETLKKYWGYDRFRPMQEEIVSEALAGRDVLAILPTGGGKSICFQVPAMMRPGICLVVSPLIALMKDQVQNLRDRGIPALAVYSGMTYREIDITLDNAVYGDYKFLYVSPERLRTELFQTRLSRMNVNFIVVDEAHCISQWGYDFRPDYLVIADIRKIVGTAVPVVALTATATPQVAGDIMERLGFRSPNLLRGDFARPNLSYVFRETDNKMGQLLKVCRGVDGTDEIANHHSGEVRLTALLTVEVIDAGTHEPHQVLYLILYICIAALYAKRQTAVVHGNVAHKGLWRPHHPVARTNVFEYRRRSSTGSVDYKRVAQMQIEG